MARTPLIIRPATVTDSAAMARVDAASWPTELATTAAEWVARILAFPLGQLVAERSGRIVGSSSAQRITNSFLTDNQETYNLVTDTNRFTGSHTADGKIYQLVGVAVLPECRGENLGRQLVDRQITFARSLPGVTRIVGFTRPAEYHQHDTVAIEDYVPCRGRQGHFVDTVLAFHLAAGAQVVSIHAKFRPNDVASRAYGVLIEYPADGIIREPDS
jgi:ribosomal protein S18 acetylase RimI-like enzyme